MNLPLKLGLVALLASAAGTTNAHAQMRFQGMDRNHDGVITRDEWRGSNQSFQNQDWNNDGVLSGEEVRTGARRPFATNRDWNQDGVVDQQDTLIARRFGGFDRNGDGRLTMAEWSAASADRGLFDHLDSNHDRTLTIAEYASGGGMRFDSQGGPAYGFMNLDRNHDGWITRNEWGLGDATFSRIDANRDNRISQYEFQSYATNSNPSYTAPSYAPNDRFTALDTNHDGLITWNEWRGTEGEYVRLDTNGDVRLSRSEFESNPAAVNRFAMLDTNHDGWLTRDEWKWSDGSYYRMDTDSDNRVGRFEFQQALASDASNRTFPSSDDRNNNGQSNNQNNNQNNNGQNENRYTAQRNSVAQAGYDRGVSEGRQAGREDATNGHGWDLEGQTELERADSGYYPQLGPLSEYQAGYREGFRLGYPQGFGQR